MVAAAIEIIKSLVAGVLVPSTVRKSLKWRFMAPFGLLLMLMLVASLARSLLTLRDEGIPTLQRQTVEMADLLAESLSFPLWNLDELGASRIIKAALRHRGAVWVQVVLPEGKIWLEQGAPTRSDAELVVAEAPITYEAMTVGTLRVGASTGEVISRTIAQAAQISILFLGGAALLLFSLWAIAGGVTRPILALAAAMLEISKSQGDRRREIPGVGRVDEIGQMAAAVTVFRDNALALERLGADRVAIAEANLATLETLAKIGQEITATLDAAEIFARLHKFAGPMLDARALRIGWLAPDGKTIEVPFSVGSGRLIGDALAYDVDDPTSPSALSVREGREVLVESDGTALSRPLSVGERTLGVISIETRRPRAYQERERLIFRMLASYTAVALANADAYRRLAASEVLERLAEIGQDITATLDVEAVFETLHRQIGELLDAPVYYIGLLTANGEAIDVPFYVENDARLRRAFGFPVDDPVRPAAKAVRENGEVLVNRDEAEAARAAAVWGEGLMATRSSLYRALTVGDRKLGVISVQSTRPNAYGERERLIFRLLAAYSAVAIANAEAYRALDLALEDLTVAKGEADRANRAKSDFVSSMSHEIRTPMNGVLGVLDLLQSTPLDAEQMELLRICQESATVLLTVIDDILDFTKIEAGKLTIESVELEIEPLVFGVVNLLAMRAWAKDLDFTVFVAPDVPSRIKGDPVRLRQILLNLVGNAIKFTPSGHVAIEVTRIEAAPSAGADRVVLRFSVEDTGIGMSEEERARLFQPFEQARATTTRRFGGTGLGLFICSRLLAMMGTTIQARGEPGKGSVFSFELAAPVVESADPPAIALTGLRILLACDAPATTRHLHRYLGHAGAAVVAVETHESALALASQPGEGGPFAAILMNETLGGRKSKRAVKKLREREVEAAIILLARRDNAALFKLAREDLPSVTVLPKVVRCRDLALAIARACGRETHLFRSPSRREIGGDGSREVGALFAGARVLIVEDGTHNRVVIRKMLQRLGIEPVLAEHGLEALAHLDGAAFDLVLTDCNMPEMDGYEMTRRIREREADGGPRLPVVALSAGVMPEDIDRCRAAGMDDFLGKPIDPEKLRATLERWLGAGDDRATDLGAATPSLTLAAADGGEPALDLALVQQIHGALDEDTIRMLRRFLELVEPSIERLRDRLAEADWPEAREAAHRVGGEAITAGGRGLWAVCAELQSAIKAGDHDRATALAPLLGTRAAELRDAISALRPQADAV